MTSRYAGFQNITPTVFHPPESYKSWLAWSFFFATIIIAMDFSVRKTHEMLDDSSKTDGILTITAAEFKFFTAIVLVRGININ